MVCRVLRLIVVDARKCFDKSKCEKAKRVLPTHHVCMEYLAL